MHFLPTVNSKYKKIDNENIKLKIKIQKIKTSLIWPFTSELYIYNLWDCLSHEFVGDPFPLTTLSPSCATIQIGLTEYFYLYIYMSLNTYKKDLAYILNDSKAICGHHRKI